MGISQATVEEDPKQKRRDALIEEYRAYVSYVVGYLIDSMRLPVEHADEFIAAGYLGLVEAAERFDFGEGKSFKNFAFLRIRGAIIDSIRECSDLSGKAYHYAKALRAAHDIRELYEDQQTTESPAKEEQLASILEYAAQGAMAFRVSIADCGDAISTEGTFGENPEVGFLNSEQVKKMRSLIATLPEKERLVIEGYYFNDFSFVDIAKQLGDLSKSWVSRLHDRALKHLSELLAEADAVHEP